MRKYHAVTKFEHEKPLLHLTFHLVTRNTTLTSPAFSIFANSPTDLQGTWYTVQGLT